MASSTDMIVSMLHDQRIRFILVGGINFFVSYVTYVTMIYLGAHYFIANIAMTVVGVPISYILHKHFTFRQHTRSLTEALRFFSVYVINFLLINLSSYIQIYILKCNSYFAGAINIVLITLLSWFGHRYFSFKQ